MDYSLILDGFNTKKKVTSTITLSLSRLVLKFTGLETLCMDAWREEKK